MRELWTMWNNTRMIVLTAVVAALYAAVLIPFKIAIPLIPGVTEVRPANAIPVVCSILFGPAAAWGAAIGNLIGDFFGTLGVGSIGGFVGNFLYGYVPYRVWRIMAKGDESPLQSRASFVRFLAAAALASAACALSIGWWADTVKAAPFGLLGLIIFFNNFLMAAVLGPLLLAALFGRARRWGMYWRDMVEDGDLAPARSPRLGLALLAAAAFAGLVLGFAVSVGLYHVPIAAGGWGAGAKGELGVAVGVLPFVLLTFIACALI